MSETIRVLRGRCPQHGAVLFRSTGEARPRCPKCHRGYGRRDERQFLEHVSPYGAADWDAAREVSELRACEGVFGREWSARRHRLGFCALARMYFAHARQYWLWKAVEAGEAWADTGAPTQEANDIFLRLRGDAFDRHRPGPAKPGEWTWLAASCVCGELIETNEFDTGWGPHTYRYPPPTFDVQEPSLEPAPAVVYRELVANPFVPVKWNPNWLDSTVRDLAAHIYEAHEFGAMPILADALQDAGCTDEPVLAHCRANRPHARGCWVLDAILGKS